MNSLPKEQIFEALITIQQHVASEKSPEFVLLSLLESFISLSESKGGFLAGMSSKQKKKEAKLICSGNPTEDLSESNHWKTLFTEKNLISLFTEDVSHTLPTIANQKEQIPSCLKENDPHDTLEKLLLLPINKKDSCLGFIALANRAEGYQEELILELSPLLTLGTIIMRTYCKAQDHEAAEKALQESRIQLRQVIDLVPHHIFAIVPSDGGRFIFANKSVADVYGMTTDEVVGKTQRDITPVAEEEEHFLADDLEVIRSGKRKFIPEETYTDPSGKTHYLQTTKIPFKAVGVEEAAVLGICVDITEQKRAEEERLRMEAQIQHAQKLESLGILAGGIAHDFNNILTGILGHSSLAMLDAKPESRLLSRLSAIEKSSKRAAELCRQMLAYSGKGKFVIKAVDLSALVTEMSDMLSISVSKKAKIIKNLAEDLPAIEADVTQIQQIIINLITNASDALGNNSGTIEISTGQMHCASKYLETLEVGENLPEGEYVYLEVKDTGCGMDKETQRLIFDPFFSTKFTGRGLGMAAALGIIRGHRGAIQIASSLGKGSTFKIFFPACSRTVEFTPPSQEKESDLSGTGLVLVVDDEETVRNFAKTALEQFGFQVLTAVDGSEAVSIFRSQYQKISTVLLDMTMPGLSGEETFHELKQISPNVPILLSSGYNEQEAITRFEGKQLAGFVQKPYRAIDLLQRVKDILP